MAHATTPVDTAHPPAELIAPRGTVHLNLTPDALHTLALDRGEGVQTEGGPLAVLTTPHTGRSPKDKYIVREGRWIDEISWGKVNQPLDPVHFDGLLELVQAHLNSRPDLFIRDAWAGADRTHRLGVRVVNEDAWHNLFAGNMFRRPEAAELADFQPDVTVLHAPHLDLGDRYKDFGLNSPTFIAVRYDKGLVIIGGTRYSGEVKKSVFSILNTLLPDRGVLPMHCSANIGESGDTAVFFGLSGTGKTTLSADPTRRLIGDDEHGWSERGTFNFEGGCYAKVIKLSPENEPEIFATTRRRGTLLENVVVDSNGKVDFNDGSITENTRASYPLEMIPNHVPDGLGGIPSNLIFLTADAYGVLPPVAKLTDVQAMYHFLSGYTAKVAGTERGVTEPTATFSACFGAPFLPLHPTVYATMLGEKLRTHGATVWLVNTGWTGGAYGTGKRIDLPSTRRIVQAILTGELTDVETVTDPVFGLAVPKSVPGVDDKLLTPRSTWADPAAYDAQAAKLAKMFRDNFDQFTGRVDPAVAAAGPNA